MGNYFFKPDLFSRSLPGFNRVSEEIRGDISNIINTYYTDLGHEVDIVEKLSGLEINSKNFKVIVGERTYALKRINGIARIANCNEQLSVSQTLLKRGILFPRVVRNNDGALVSSSEDSAIWILTEFIKGDYFSGYTKDFFTIARGTGAMQYALETLLPKNLPVSVSVGTWNQTCNIISELLERKNEWSTLFPPPECGALIREHEYFANSFHYIVDNLPDVPSNIVPTHIDIHPHNILITANRDPVFVDTDSLQWADRIQSMAFATYKLARQHVVYEALAGAQKEIAKTTRVFVDTLVHAAKIEKCDIPYFPVAATAEVMRRIALIADLNMHKENREWNAVLHMHFSALHEIPQLFADFPPMT